MYERTPVWALAINAKYGYNGQRSAKLCAAKPSTLDYAAALRHINPCSFGSDEFGADLMPIIHDFSQVLGDCSGFYLQQARRLLKFGVDIDGLEGKRFDGFYHAME